MLQAGICISGRTTVTPKIGNSSDATEGTNTKACSNNSQKRLQLCIVL